MGGPASRGFRVTKYDPTLRDAEGRFLGDEWTSLTDLPDTPTAMAAYRRTEDEYIACVRETLSVLAPASLSLVGVEKHSSMPRVPASLDVESRALRAEARALPHTITPSQAEVFVRAALRELMWGKIEGSDGSYIHVGYDYYLYIGAPSGQLRPMASSPLFWEPMDSPYL